MADQLLFERTCGEPELADLGRQIASHLTQPFCLWLLGGMGAGKTTITRHLLRGIGLSDRVPVTSPTFSYVNEYRIHSRTFAHTDLYRIEGAVDLAELGLGGSREFFGTIVEWPERVGESVDLAPNFKLAIDYEPDDHHRRYRFYRCDRLPQGETR